MDNKYYNLHHSYAYSGARNFKPKEKRWLKSQFAYTLNKKVIRKFKRNQYYSKGINDFMQADLADMSKLSKSNRGFKFLLFCIDVFSKYLHVEPIKSKKPQDVLNAFKKMKIMPNLLMTDKGTEFRNDKLMSYFKSIKYYTSQNPDIKCGVVERVIRTIKKRLYRYMTHKATEKYIDVLPDIVHGYNNSKHTTIKMKPSEVNEDNENIVRNTLYKPPTKVVKPKLKKGDAVRITKEKGVFHKGYKASWSEEIFYIDDVIPTQVPTYKLVDYYNESISGTCYPSELQLVEPVFRIEKILKRQSEQVLIKCLGYTEKTWQHIDTVL